jgi:hypothetical protein
MKNYKLKGLSLYFLLYSILPYHIDINLLRQSFTKKSNYEPS